jgi:hypothetical protein
MALNLGLWDEGTVIYHKDKKGLTIGTNIEADSHIFMTPMNFSYIKRDNF